MSLILAFMGLILSREVFGGPTTADEIGRVREAFYQMRDKSRWVDAMSWAEKWARMAKDCYGQENTNTADAVHWWAYTVQHNGDLDRAEELWLEALAIDEQLFGKDTLETTRRLHLLANLYRDQGDYRRAMQLLQRALRIREQSLGPNHGETAQIVRSIGYLQTLQGDYAAAETSLLRAIAAYELVGDYAYEALAAAWSALGGVYIYMGDYEKAQEPLRESYELRKKIHGPEHASVAYSLREMAQVQRFRGALAKAEQLFCQSLSMLERLLGTNHVIVGNAVADLGITYLMTGDLARAEPFLRRCAAIREEALGTNHPRAASSMMMLGRLEEKKGNYEQARKLCEEAFRRRERQWGPRHVDTLASLRKVATLEAALGRREHAIRLAEQIQDGEEELLANILSFTSERQRLASQSHSFLFKERCDLWGTLGATKPLVRAVLRTKGLVLDSIIEDRVIATKAGDPEVQDTLSQIVRARRRLAAYGSFVGNSLGGTNEGSSAAALVESLEAKLARKIGVGLGRARRGLSVEPSKVVAAIGYSNVLIEFVRYLHHGGNGGGRDSYGALILSADNEARWVSLGAARPIDKSIKFFHHAVRRPEAAETVRECLGELYRRVWAPIAKEIPFDRKQVIISPDGEINFVPYATLLTPDGRCLGEDYLFSYISSARDLLVENEATCPNSDLLIWANPEFDAVEGVGKDTLSLGSGQITLCPLPGAEKEGRMLWERKDQLGFAKAALYTGKDATEEKIFEVHSPKVLHLATHGFILPQVEERHSEEIGAAEFDTGNALFTKINPMLRSGLALAGARRTIGAWSEGRAVPSENDGVLTTIEIGALDLRGTELVVLSACETAGGENQAGEGVLGLRRGFVQAGARNLLMTLWPVEDGRSAEFMLDFYKLAHKTGNLTKALSWVQREWLRRLRAESGVAEACRIAGPFILSFQGQPGRSQVASGHDSR